MRKMANAMMLAGIAGMVACIGVHAEDAPAADAAPVAAAVAPVVAPAGCDVKQVEDGKKQLAKLRGKLLYKKGQVRKMEKGVTSNDATLAAKVAEMERQRREVFVTAEPKLAALYEEQDSLEQQVQEASDAVKK